MTLDEFLDALEKAPIKWELVECDWGGLAIRKSPHTHGSHVCPLLALRVHTVEDGFTGGIRRSLYWKIALAADEQRGHDPEIRRKLLEACKLA